MPTDAGSDHVGVQRSSAVLLSIIIPVYDVERDVGACLESVARQAEEAPVEVVLVDDCSTDRSFEVVAEVLARHPRLARQVVRHRVNQGVGQARRSGRVAAQGRFVAFLDPDDLLPAGAVSTVLEHLDATPPDGFLEFPVIRRIGADGEAAADGPYSGVPTRSVRGRSPAGLMSAAAYGRALLLGTVPGVLWTKVFPASLLTVDDLDTGRQNEDIITLCTLLAKVRAVLVVDDEIVYTCRDRPGSLSRQVGYRQASVDNYRRCLDILRGSSWYGASHEPAGHYFLVTTVWLPRLEALAGVADRKAFGDCCDAMLASVPVRTMVGFWWPRRLPPRRLTLFARGLVLGRVLPRAFAGALYRYLRRAGAPAAGRRVVDALDAAGAAPAGDPGAGSDPDRPR